MHIGIDARKIRDYGIGRFTSRLLREMVTQAPSYRFTAITWVEDLDTDLIPREVTRIPARSGNYTPGELLELGSIARRERFDLYHAPHFILPLGLPCPSLVTIHDLIHLLFPHYFPRIKVWGARYLLKRCRRADLVLTDSDSSARDLVSVLGFDPGKINTVPLAADSSFGDPAGERERSDLRQILEFQGDYLLNVGNNKAHKNIPLLLECLTRLPAEIKLVLTAPKEDRELSDKISVMGLGDRVIRPGWLPDELLPALYQEAKLFLFPSLYEGFGLPPLEAMAAGTAVVSSDTGSLAEVLGDAAVIADPHDPWAFGEAITNLLEDHRAREKYELLGREQAARYSWKQAAESVLALYRRLLG